jgi:single-strand DNA-binding protein
MINKVILLGNLGKDPDTRFTSSGKVVTRFSLATSNTWIGANGEKQQATAWHTVVVWGKQGEACSQYLEKGRQVYVEGTPRHRSYDNKDGKEQHVTEIVAEKVRFLGGGNGKAREEQPPQVDPDGTTFRFNCAIFQSRIRPEFSQQEFLAPM